MQPPSIARPPQSRSDLGVILKPGFIAAGIQTLVPFLISFGLRYFLIYKSIGDVGFVVNIASTYLIYIVTTFFLSRHLARQTGQVSPSILGALFANMLTLLFILVIEAIIYTALQDTTITDHLVEILVNIFTSSILTVVVIGSVFGWLGTLGVKRRKPSEATVLTDVEQFAQVNQLGALVKVYQAQTSANTYLLVFGGIAGLALLLILQRAVLHATGTSPAVDFFGGAIYLITLLIITLRRQGQHVYVYQEGLVGYGQTKQLRAIRWEGSTFRFLGNAFQLVSKDGNMLSISRNIEAFEELKDLAQTKTSQALKA